MSGKNKIKSLFTFGETKIKPELNLYWVIGSILVLLAVNVALTSFSIVGSLLWQIERAIISHLSGSVYLQYWSLSLLLFFSALFGDLFFPVLYVPSFKKKGSWFYLWVSEEGDLLKFYTVLGCNIMVYKPWVQRKGFRYTVTENVERFGDGRNITLDNKELDVGHSLVWQRRTLLLAEELAGLHRERVNREPLLTIEEAERIRGGGGPQ